MILYSKTPSDGTCLVKPLEGFCDVGCHFVVVLHFSFLICHFSLLICHTKQRLLINLLKGLKMCIINITKVLLVVKTDEKKFFSQVQFLRIRLLIRSATTIISQQPWKHKAAATLISSHKLQNNCSLQNYISEYKCKNYVNLCEFMLIYG